MGVFVASAAVNVALAAGLFLVIAWQQSPEFSHWR